MRFISERNWSSVGVAMVGCDEGMARRLIFVLRSGPHVARIRKSHAALKGGGLCTHVRNYLIGNIDQPCP